MGSNLPVSPYGYPAGMKLCNTWVLSCQHQLQILALRGADRSGRDAAALPHFCPEMMYTLKLVGGFVFIWILLQISLNIWSWRRIQYVGKCYSVLCNERQ